MLRPPTPWPRETRDTWFLLAVLGWILLLQAPHVPWWCSALALAVLLGRAVLAWRQRPLPPWPWKLGLLVVGLSATWWQHRTWLGQEAGVGLIALLLALKTLELRARRDAFVVFFLGFFTLLTHFFYSQSLLTALGILGGLWGLLTALVNAHMPVGRPPLWRAARLAGGMALLGTPIMLVLFLLFPRLAPLWGLPSDGTLGRSGLSSTMAVGDVARLALDDGVAFRIDFEGPAPPPGDLYFRGPVLSDFDGRQWRPEPPTPQAQGPVDLRVQGPAVRYRITLEPSNRPWLMLLEATPQAPNLPGQTAFLTHDLQWLLRRPVTDVLRYEASSHPQFQHGPSARTLALQRYLELPPGFNPRTLELAQSLQRDLGHDAPAQRYVAAVLERLRTGGYRYTLSPGLYGRHTADEFWFDRRQGFCEHIASSFVVLMRALDIPARVVTGYQGGERNPMGGFWTVRHSDAHAWAEVWLPKEGWTRVDPTTQVMPSRTGSMERLRPPPGLLVSALVTVSPDMLAQLRNWWDATNNGWNQWVLNYTQDRQLNLLQRLGWNQPDWTDLLHALLLLLASAGLGGAAWAAWRPRRSDPWLRLLAKTRQRLAQAGHAVPPAATPRQLAALLGADWPALRAWLLDLERQRYDPNAALSLRQLRRAARRLPWPPRRR